MTTALLDEAAKFASDVVSPLRRVGDAHPARCRDSVVTIPPGYGEAIQQLGAGGWVGISAPQDQGGQGLPELFGTAACEMWNSADMAFALEPFLSAGAGLAISAHASDDLKSTYLEKIYSGEWSGTMNLTESGAGSDLGPMKTRAERGGRPLSYLRAEDLHHLGRPQCHRKHYSPRFWLDCRMPLRAAGGSLCFWCPNLW